MLIRLGTQLLVQEALQEETTERLGRAPYQDRQPEGAPAGLPQRLRAWPSANRWRGYRGPGAAGVRMVREELYRSRLMAFLRCYSHLLEPAGGRDVPARPVGAGHRGRTAGCYR